MEHEDDATRRDTTPPPPPPTNDEWRTDLRSTLKQLQDETDELARLAGKLYASTARVWTLVMRMGHAVSRIPKE